MLNKSLFEKPDTLHFINYIILKNQFAFSFKMDKILILSSLPTLIF